MLTFSSSYNGAWWFLFTYILLVVSSSALFKIINQAPSIILICSLMIYFIAFYFKVYSSLVFDLSIFNWFKNQISLYGISLFPFFIGALSLKQKWNTKISIILENVKYKNAIAIIGICFLVLIHGLIPNYIIAPFLAIPFVFLFIQINLPKIFDNALDLLAPHTTNIWLVHMFFYITFFSTFIYSPKYIFLIFFLLVACSLISSFFINRIYSFIIRKIRLT